MKFGFYVYRTQIQLFENPESFEIWTFLKVGFQIVRFSNARALAMAIATNHLKSGQFHPYFKRIWTKWWPFVRIFIGWASGFQIPFEIWTICNPTSF